MASLLRSRASSRAIPCAGMAFLACAIASAPAAGQLASHALTLEDAAVLDSITTLEAARGDGIWDLLQRAGVQPTPAAIEAFKRRNRGRLIHGDELLAGRSYTVPANGSRVGTFPIFGSKYERVERSSDRLAGRIYYIVSGHGGPDPGTVGRYAGRKLPEDEIAYDVSLRLARRLLEEGATVYLIVQDPNDGIRDGRRFPLAAAR